MADWLSARDRTITATTTAAFFIESSRDFLLSRLDAYLPSPIRYSNGNARFVTAEPERCGCHWKYDLLEFLPEGD
jgi:hypothetical protein